MSEKNQTSSLPVLGVLLALGLMAAAFILGVQFKNLRQPGTITVKGLAEKNFKSDSATWNTGVEAHADSYQVSGSAGLVKRQTQETVQIPAGAGF